MDIKAVLLEQFDKFCFGTKKQQAFLENLSTLIADGVPPNLAIEMMGKVSKGIDKKDIVFNSVNTRKNTRANYSNEGRYLGEDFLGYILSQTLQIESKEVEKIEKLSREITELLNKGVQFYSQPPRYYYTKLSDLKIELVSKATEDARLRAEKIAENSGSTIGKLISADMGIFQITGQNSSEEYSWGGTFNTESKAKTASITMRLKYQVD